ncbi:MAG: hypothetical protein ACM3ML_13200 [Micromonosporaceae bacterium]
MRWNKPGPSSRIPTGRGIAVTSASGISAAGAVAAVVICLVMGLLIGQSVLHGNTKPSGSGARPASATRTSARPSPTRKAAPTGKTLARAVRRLMAAKWGIAASHEYGTLMTRSPVVNFVRVKRNKTWVLGTTAIPLPPGTVAPAVTALFIAHVRRSGWDVALSGTPGFAHMLPLALGKVVTLGEAKLLARFSALQNARAAGRGATPLALPWVTGQSWRLGVVPGDRASERGTASIAVFSGGDGRVRAAGPGRLYRFCADRGHNALIEVIHSDGSATQYGQLGAQTRVVDGTFVARGAYLGMTGTSLACGGAAVRAKAGPRGGAVAFAVLRGGSAVNLDGVTLGGWTLHEKGTPPVLSAQRAKTQVKPGGLMKNFGVAAKKAPAAKAKATTKPGSSAGPSPAVSPHKSTQRPTAAPSLAIARARHP